MSELLGLLLLLAIAGVMVVLLLTALIVRGARRPPRHTIGYAIARNLPSDPGEIGLDYEEWMLKRPDGSQLPVWEINLSSPAHSPNAIDGDTISQAGCVVLIHGWGQSRIDMLRFMSFWRNRAGLMILYDLRGHGESTGSLSPLGSGEERDLLALLDRLDPDPPTSRERFILVGWSMGAVIAINAAAEAQRKNDARIAGIVALGPYDSFRRALFGRLRAAGHPAGPMGYLAMLWFRLIGIRHRPTHHAATNLRTPLLIIHGREDAVVPVSEAECIADAAPHTRLHMVEEAGHLDLPEVDAAGQNRAIEEFLSRIEG